MMEGNLDKSKAWFEYFKQEVKAANLPESRAYVACCNIDWLIQEVERLSDYEKN